MERSDVNSTANETATESVPSSSETSERGGRPKCFNSTLQEVFFVLTATMAMGMSSFLLGICTVITAQIGRDLKMNSAEITWINAASALSSGAFLLFFAKVADSFGRRPLLIFGMGAFTISCLISGFANSPMYLDVFCGILGLWSAAAVPPAVGILGSAYDQPSSRKNKAFACFSAGNPVGFVLGSIFSGIAADLFNWRASFYLMSIIYAVVFLAAIWTVPKDRGERERLTLASLKKFDLLGILLSMAGIALFSSSLTIAGDAPNGWKTSYVLVLLILGILLIGTFISWENFCKFPVMPLHIWKDRNFALINVIVLLGYMSFATSNFWLSLYFQNVLGMSPLQVAVHLLPQAIGGIFVNIVAGFVLHRVNNKLLAGIGALAYVCACLLLALMDEGSNYWAYIFTSLLLSVTGADLQFNVALIYVSSSLPPGQQSLGGGIFNTVTRICAAVGLGITASIYNATSVGEAALQTSIRPYRMVFWFCVASAGLGLCFVPFLTIGTQGHPGDKLIAVAVVDDKGREEREKEELRLRSEGEREKEGGREKEKAMNEGLELSEMRKAEIHL